MGLSETAFSKLEYIGEGTEGIVRKKDNDVLKMFFKLDEYKKLCLDKQYKLPTQSFIFPKEKLYISGKYIGCINDYIIGQTLEEFDFERFDQIIKFIKIIENELIILSKKNIAILDLTPQNALYNSEGFKIIDTTKYQIANDEFEAQCCNIRRLNYFFLQLILFKKVKESDFLKLISQKELLLQYYQSLNYLDANTNFSKFLECFLNEFNILTNDEYKQKVLKRIN